MTITAIKVEAMQINDAPSLDAIQVFWRDCGVGQGYVTIICYGCAWTAYFGGMGTSTIRDFFAGCDTGYMVNKMGQTHDLKQPSVKKYEAYLGRIIEAVKAALAQERVPVEAVG